LTRRQPGALFRNSAKTSLFGGYIRRSKTDGSENARTDQHRRGVPARYTTAAAVVLLGLSVSCERAPSAPDPNNVVAATFVGTTETSQYTPPSPDPSGIAYAAHLNSLVIADGEVDEMTIYAGVNMFETTLSHSPTRTWTTIPITDEPTGVTYNPANRHLFLSDDDEKEVYELDPGPDGQYSTSDDLLTHFDTEIFGSTDPEGLAFDVHQGVLFIVDGENERIYRVSPGANGMFDGVAPGGDDQLTSFDTQVHGLTDPEGIAYDSDRGYLYVVGRPKDRIFQLSTDGALLGTIDISPVAAIKPAGLEYVRAGSSVPMLYLVDRGLDNNSAPHENDGKLYQFALPAPTPEFRAARH
jgi:DNA-binding beta-propeller fold protein YncE